MSVFCDLRESVMNGTLTGVGLCAVGGIPIVRNENGTFTLFEAPVSELSLRKTLTEGLGLGAVLTYENPNNKSLLQLGEMCLTRKHLWTTHALSLTLLYGKVPISVRNMFAFDSRFHLSWIAREESEQIVTFTAASSIKQWARMIRHKDDNSFSTVQRSWLNQTYEVVNTVFPL